MAASRSTPRLRITMLVLAGTVALVAVSERPAAVGLAGQWLQLAGLALVTAAALGRVWTSVFIAGSKDVRLVRQGPYAVVRHPLYALSLVAVLGIGLTTRSLALTGALFAAFTAIYVMAARAEDRFLANAHAADFVRYSREVRGFLPGRPASAVPDAIEVRPRILWKAFLDAASLIGLWLLLVLADGLQRAAITPTWLSLP
jgi:protein-S-isoprenylcysteine O-methyltransferase Ste14